MARKWRSAATAGALLQTVTRLAEALKLTPVTTHTKGEEQALVADAIGRPGTVLICWQHEDIAAIGNLIVGNNTTVRLC